MQSKLACFILGAVFATALMKLPYLIALLVIAIVLWLATTLLLFFVTTYYLFLTLVMMKEVEGFCGSESSVISAYPSPGMRCSFI